jgi:glycosyltransferase involved in cell wall biosynthesis
MNIGFVCNEIPPGPSGGIGVFTAELTRGLIERGHSVHLVSVDAIAKKDDCEVLSAALTIHRLAGGSGRLRGYLNRLRLFRLIRKLAAQRRIDIVEVPDFEGWCAGWQKLPVPVVVRLHGSATYFSAEMQSPLSASTKVLERLAIQRADHVISVSNYTADRTAAIFGLRLAPAVIHNSVVLPDSARLKAQYGSRDLVCYSGTLVQKKGVFSLARAWPSIKQRRPNARLMLIGRDGRQGDRSSVEVIRELAGSHAESIDIVGHKAKAEVEALLSAADVAVYPSYSEAFALAPMEAMALGVPTIYSIRASGRELIRDGVDGWLCDPDNIDQLADQVATLLEDESLRHRLGHAGRLRIREAFSYEKFLQDNIDLYQRCIKQRDEVSGLATEIFPLHAPSKPI